MSRVLVVEHDAECPPALFGGWLERGRLRRSTCAALTPATSCPRSRRTTRC